MKIDVVSDVACPWCAVGLHALEIALERTGLRDTVELHFQPFELNPTMPPEGADTATYLMKKYGMGPAQLAQGRETLRQRGAAVGFTFGDRPWVWNTFDAHRLLCWAETAGRQRELKHALISAYHGRAENVSDAAVLAQGRETLRQRGAAVGFTFGDRPWVWNTFDAHRLLCWAETEGRQRELKHALISAYHGRAENVSDAAVLARLAGEAGLDTERATQILAGDEFAAEVREREAHWQGLGISAVPSVVIDDRHLIQGGQPPEVFEQALRQLAAQVDS